MATQYIQKFESVAAFLAFASDVSNAAGFGVVSDILYQNVGGVAVAVDLAKSQQEIVTATNVILASESGKTFFLNSSAEFVSTLPAPAVGLRYKFVVTAAPSGASYTIVGASGTPIHGVGVSSADAGGNAGSTAGTGVLTITFVDGQAKKGDTVIVESDGTDWYALAFMSDEDAITFS